MSGSSASPGSASIEAADGSLADDGEFDPLADWDQLHLPPRDAVTGVWQHVHENGRRYHLYKYGRYPIPNDDAEQQREDIKHAMMLELTGGKLYYAPIGNAPRKIIDIGTGTGIWAIEMGDCFPDAQVLGTDLSPIQPEWLPENVRFVVDDCEADWINGAGWDYAHFRHIASVLTRPDEMIEKTFAHLKPGGWIEFQDLHTYPFCDDGTMAADDPVAGFCDLLRDGLDLRGMSLDKMRALRRPLQRAGFTDIRLIKKKVPLGSWAADRTLRLIGHYLKTAVLDILPSLMARPISELGLNAVEQEVWMATVRQSLEDTRIHRHFHFYFWYARKPLTA